MQAHNVPLTTSAHAHVRVNTGGGVQVMYGTCPYAHGRGPGHTHSHVDTHVRMRTCACARACGQRSTPMRTYAACLSLHARMSYIDTSGRSHVHTFVVVHVHLHTYTQMRLHPHAPMPIDSLHLYVRQRTSYIIQCTCTPDAHTRIHTCTHMRGRSSPRSRRCTSMRLMRTTWQHVLCLVDTYTLPSMLLRDHARASIRG